MSATKRYVELQCAFHFSFLRGASGCDELFAQTQVCGVEALASYCALTLRGRRVTSSKARDIYIPTFHWMRSAFALAISDEYRG